MPCWLCDPRPLIHPVTEPLSINSSVSRLRLACFGVASPPELGVCGGHHQSLLNAEASEEDPVGDGPALHGSGRERRAGVELQGESHG